MQSSSTFDVVVAGAGPAGLAVAAELVGAGRSVAVVDPRPERAWPHTYGAFYDELEALDLAGCVARAWSRPLVYTDDAPRVLGRTYALIDNQALQARLRGAAAGAAVLAGRVLADVPAGAGVQVALDGGRSLTASVLVDASGAGTLLHRAPSGAAQVAVGRVVRLASVPWGAEEAVWMDLRGPGDRAPSFLYALPLGGDRVLLEETSLASSPPMAWTELEARLDARIAQLGLRVLEILDHERVFIPLDGRVQAPRGAVVGFGAAGGLVHPSTGYSVVRSLREAPGFAAAIGGALSRGDLPGAAGAAHAALWSPARRRTRALHEAGLGVLLSLDAARTRRFFDAFYALPQARQAAWLDGTASPASVAASMAALFVAAPWSVRADVLSAVTDVAGRALSYPIPRTGGPA